MIKNILGASRYLVIVAVISALMATITLLLWGFYRTALSIYQVLEGETIKSISTAFIELADLYLLSVVMFIIAIGLYKLFIDEDMPTPAWLEINHLDDLKTKLLNVIIIVLAVYFLKQVVAWDNETNLLFFGGGIAVMIAALTYFLGAKTKQE